MIKHVDVSFVDDFEAACIRLSRYTPLHVSLGWLDVLGLHRLSRD